MDSGPRKKEVPLLAAGLEAPILSRVLARRTSAYAFVGSGKVGRLGNKQIA